MSECTGHPLSYKPRKEEGRIGWINISCAKNMTYKLLVKEKGTHTGAHGQQYETEERVLTPVDISALNKSKLTSVMATIMVTMGHSVKVSKDVKSVEEIPTSSPALITMKMCGCHVTPGQASVTPPGLNYGKSV